MSCVYAITTSPICNRHRLLQDNRANSGRSHNEAGQLGSSRPSVGEKASSCSGVGYNFGRRGTTVDDRIMDVSADAYG